MSARDGLETYLSGHTELSRIYRAGKRELPSEHLDEVISAAARQAVVNPSGTYSLAWTLPVSLAAAVVLGASLILFMHLSQEAAVHSRAVPRVAIPESIPSVMTPETASIAKTSETNRQELEAADPPENVEISSLQPHSSAEIMDAGTEANPGEDPEEDTELARKLSLPEPQWTVELMDDPKAWLEYIELLVLKNRVNEADTHLRAFTERHPAVPLLETLLAIMSDPD